VARSLRFLSALGAFFVLAGVVAACGGVPGNSVAKVGDSTITKKTFDHWMGVAAHSSQPPGSTGTVSVPDSPNFKKCIAAKRRTTPAPAKGQPQQTDAQLKSACKTEFEGLRDQVMGFLIQAKWVEGEASDQGVKISNKEVQTEFQKQKQQAFPQDAEFQRFLKTSGFTLTDIKFRVKLDLFQKKLLAKIGKQKPKVTDKQIADYYAKNQQRFGQPEKRDLEVVLTKTAAKANEAKSAIAGGQAFAAVAKKFSIDQVSKNQGGKLTGLAKGQQEKALDDAVFSAKLKQLVGPVKTQFGFYVFRVTKSTPASQQTLDQSKTQIRALLTTQSQQSSRQKFITKFQKKWKSRTDCRKDFVVQNCKNAPKPKQQPGLPPGAVPQTGAGGAQQAPQTGAPQQVPQTGAPQQVPQGTPQQAPQTGAPTGP
jgi:foldase protein PrsA